MQRCVSFSLTWTASSRHDTLTGCSAVSISKASSPQSASMGSMPVHASSCSRIKLRDSSESSTISGGGSRESSDVSGAECAQSCGAGATVSAFVRLMGRGGSDCIANCSVCSGSVDSDDENGGADDDGGGGGKLGGCDGCDDCEVDWNELELRACGEGAAASKAEFEVGVL